MKFKLFLVLVSISVNLTGLAQSGITNLNSYMPVVPHSPEVASMLKYQETPVSKNSGIPQINIPIHTIAVDGLSIPVSLNYHSGGVRVNEIAPRTGQGWNLIAGGSITRTVKHLNDDHLYGYIWTNIKTEDIYDACVSGIPAGRCDGEITQKLLANELDFEPDIFSYSAPGINGKFMFNQVTGPQGFGEIKSFPLTNNKIEVYFDGKRIDSWIITDVNGNKFYFEEGNVLKSTKGSTLESSGNLPTFDDDFGPSSPEYTETWNLTKIKTTKGELIIFGYSSTEDCVDCTFSGQAMGKVPGERGNLKTTYIQSVRNYKELEGIYGSFGSIKFNTSETPRKDFPTGAALSEIEIRDNNDALTKKFDLRYVYTQSAYPNALIFGCKESPILYDPNNPDSYESYTKRLFLKEIEVYGMHGVSGPETPESNKYVFDYNDDHILPHRNSYAQDFWGFYNGATNSTLLFDNPNNSITSRLVNQEYAVTGLLKKIYYPGGGYTQFTYENNRATMVSGNFLAYRLIPFDEKNLEFDTSIDQGVEEFNYNTFEYEYIYRKPLILGPRTFNLDKFNGPTFERRALFNTIIDSRNSNGEVICIQENPDDLPQEHECSFWLRIRKTTLDIADYPDESYIDVENLDEDDYDSDFSLDELLSDSYRSTYVPAAIYVMELVLRNPTGGLGNQTEEFDVVNDRALANIKYKVATEDIIFSQDYNYVEIPVGGQRIAKIEDFTDENILVKAREFQYVLEDGLNTSGNILRIPHFYSKVNGNVSESSLPAVPLITIAAGNVAYTRVVENIVGYTNGIPNQSIVSTYRYPPLLPQYKKPMIPFMDDYRYGQEETVEIPSKKLNSTVYSDEWIEMTTNDPSSYHYGVLSPTSNFPYRYSIGDSWTYWQYDDITTGAGIRWSGDTFYNLQYGHTQLANQKDITYINENPEQAITKKTIYKYNNPEYYQPSSIESVIDVNKRMIQKFYYPYDLFGVEPFAENLMFHNRLAAPIIEESYMVANGQERLLSKNKMTYSAESGKVLPNIIYTAKGGNNLEPRLVYNNYDAHGNPIDISVVGGTHTSYIWGYNGQHLVAKIEKLSHAQLPSQLVADIEGTTNEVTLLSYLQQLRDLQIVQNSQVTTYTYKPLIGISTITDPKGYKITYVYDGFGRLKYVKDMEGNVLSENQYHYKND